LLSLFYCQVIYSGLAFKPLPGNKDWSKFPLAPLHPENLPPDLNAAIPLHGAIIVDNHRLVVAHAGLKQGLHRKNIAKKLSFCTLLGNNWPEG
jgi:hypothetical protein